MNEVPIKPRKLLKSGPSDQAPRRASPRGGAGDRLDQVCKAGLAIKSPTEQLCEVERTTKSPDEQVCEAEQMIKSPVE
jgi:hypothetical protein